MLTSLSINVFDKLEDFVFSSVFLTVDILQILVQIIEYSFMLSFQTVDLWIIELHVRHSGSNLFVNHIWQILALGL